MNSISKKAAAFASVFGATMTFACVVVALPATMRIEVSNWDIFVAGLTGETARQVFLENLDEEGQDLFGEQNWHDNQYNGYVLAEFNGDIHQVYISKPCDADAVDGTAEFSYGEIDTGEGGGPIDTGIGPGEYGPMDPNNPYENCSSYTIRTCSSQGNVDYGCRDDTYLDCP